ncbi:MAG: Fe-S cluster assembly ATPase SufC [Kiritimatiellae bacterium]|nr:Fe-S cluster assembly ATPase SufC [Kiritimatiellia bacterium]
MSERDPILEIENLEAAVAGRPILRGVSLTVCGGEVHALMGPNGSGKSTLSNVLMGHPDYEVTGGTVRLRGEDVLGLAPEERARRGLFLAFQYPVAIPGVTTVQFLKACIEAVRGRDAARAGVFLRELRETARFLEMDESFLNRPINEGFSGGEKKRMEILQMLMLKPKMVVLDETDSGLDIDALKVVARGVQRVVGPEVGVLIITHYERILNHLPPDHVHILVDGRIARSGGPELVRELEARGYDWLREPAGAEVAGEG